MDNCLTIGPNAGPAEIMIGKVDCFMQSSVQAGYAGMLGQGSAFSYGLTIALTLYVALVGYRLILGRSSLSLSEMAPRMLLIGAVLALTSSWATYQTLVYDVLTDGPQEVTSMINTGSGGKAGINARIDTLSGRMVDLADAWTAADARAGPDAATMAAENTLPATPTSLTALVAPKDSLGPNMLLLSALLLVLASTGVLVVAKIILGLLLLLGPIFAALALFPTTRGLTIGWARASVLMTLVPLMAMIASTGAIALLEPLVAEMIVAASQDVYSLKLALVVLVVVLIMAAVAVQLFRTGRTIVGGWTIRFGETAATNAHSVSVTSAPSQVQPQNFLMDERMRSLVSSIEKTALTAQNPGVFATRSIALLHRQETATAPSRVLSNVAGRLVNRGSVTAHRAPIKPYRSAA